MQPSPYSSNSSSVGEPSPATKKNFKRAETWRVSLGRHIIEMKFFGLPFQWRPVYLAEYGVTLWRDLPGMWNHRRLWWLTGGLSVLSRQDDPIDYQLERPDASASAVRKAEHYEREEKRTADSGTGRGSA